MIWPFNLLQKKQPTEEIVGDTNALPEIRESDFVDHSEPTETNHTVIAYGTRLPIDIIYSFLKEDYEGKAYNDAITNPDKSYKENNLAIIRSDLEVKFKQVLVKYADMLEEIEFHIQSRRNAGLTDIVEQLISRKQTYTRHVEEIDRMQADLDRGELYMVGIFKSYEVGFTRGLASLSLHSLQINNSL